MEISHTKRYMLLIVLLTIIVSSFTTAVLIYTVDPPVAQAQQTGPFDGLTLYAGPRRDTYKNESFIFVNSRTGDIWVYRDTKLKQHYRIVEMGQELEKIKD